MARKGRHQRGGRTTPKGTRPGGFRPQEWGAGPEPDEPDLLRQVRAELAAGDPLGLLADVSGLAAVTDPRLQELARGSDPGPPLEELVASLEDVDCLETTALLAGLAHLAADDFQRRRAARIVAARRHPLPAWLDRVGEAVAYRAAEMVHVLGDGDDVIVGVRFADGQELTAVVYVDHNLGTVAKDGFAVPGPIDALLTEMQGIQDPDEEMEWRELPLADARARLEDAVETGSHVWPPLESDTWPVCRPLVEWIARLLPDGGTGYQRPEWSDADRRALAEDFFASAEGRPLDGDAHRQLFESILWFACDYGPGDPLRWSPPAVESILADWLPRKIVAEPAFLAPAPDLLRAFVRYAHRERGIRRRWTDETLAAVDACEADYQRTIRSPRPQGPMALLAAMGAVDPEGPWPEPGDTSGVLAGLLAGGRPQLAGYEEMMLERLRRDVGGDAALEALDAAPLPDEALDWSGIPDDVRPTVEEVAAAADRCCDELLDAEYRTACRRLLARAASGDPQVFRRKARTDIAAAALVWVVGQGNDLFVPSRGGMRVKDLAGHFGMASSANFSQRAKTLLKAAGYPEDEAHQAAYEFAFGTADLLVSDQRRHLIDLRDRYTSA